MQPTLRAQQPPLSPRALWMISLAIAATFAAFQIQSSMASGVLSLPVTYDDVAYFCDALARLEILHRHGSWALLKNFVAVPMHAPLQTMLSMAGFGLFGPHPWAASAINVLPLALILRIFLGRACRVLPLNTSVGLAIAFLGLPIFGLLVLDIRPDILCALFTTIGALIVVADARWRAGDRRAGLVTAMLFLGALLAKPTLAPVTVFVFASAVFAVAAVYARSWTDARHFVRIGLVWGGLGLVLSLPYYIGAFREIYEYVVINVFGAHKEKFALNLHWDEHALYYLTGPGGKASIGRAWLWMSAFLLLFSAPIWLRSRRQTLAICIVAFAAYISVTAPAMKTIFIGMIVTAFAAVLVAMAMVSRLSHLPNKYSTPVVAFLVLFSVVTWKPLFLQLWGGTVPAAQTKELGRITSEIAETVAKLPSLNGKSLYFPVIGQYTNYSNLEYELRVRKIEVPIFPALYLSEDIAEHREAISRADVVILFSDDSELPLPWPVSVRIRKQIASAVSATDAFETVGVIDGGSYRGSVIILKRKGT